MSEGIWDNLNEDDLSPWFTIRTYKSLDELVPCNYVSDYIKPFPLIPQVIDNDFPTWDGGGIPADIENIIIKMEEDYYIDYFDDICEEIYEQHKIGGYPSFFPGDYWGFGKNYPFVMQISSDDKANFNIKGNFYFFYNASNDSWKVYSDFYEI